MSPAKENPLLKQIQKYYDEMLECEKTLESMNQEDDIESEEMFQIFVTLFKKYFGDILDNENNIGDTILQDEKRIEHKLPLECSSSEENNSASTS